MARNPRKASEPVVLAGKLSISRCRGGPITSGDVRITLLDASSHCELIEIRLDSLAFVEAIFARADLPCTYEFNDRCPRGKNHEHKRVEVFIPQAARWAHNDPIAKDLIRAAVAEHEVDGWQGTDRDAENSHNCLHDKPPPADQKGAWYRVAYHRWVDPPKARKGRKEPAGEPGAD